jgi:F0F1-type ATP synthase membrane subunit b/b'
MAFDFEEVGENIEKTIKPKNFKKYLPFIIVGGAIGLIGLVYSKSKTQQAENSFYSIPDETSKVSGSTESGASQTANTNAQIAQVTGFFTKSISDTYTELNKQFTDTYTELDKQFTDTYNELNKQFTDETNILSRRIDEVAGQSTSNLDELKYTIKTDLENILKNDRQEVAKSTTRVQDKSRKTVSSAPYTKPAIDPRYPEPDLIIKSASGVEVRDKYGTYNAEKKVAEVKKSVFEDPANWRDGQYIGPT